MRPFLFLLVAGILTSLSLFTFGSANADHPQNDTAPALYSIDEPLEGIVLAWQDGRIIRIVGAHIGTGQTTVRTDSSGRFTIPADIRTNQLNVVAPGYEIVREQTTADYRVIFMQPLDVRAIYFPYERLDEPATLEWALNLARKGTITSIVIDVKEEGGAVLSIVANDTAWQMDAVRDPDGTDMQAFLDELGALGVYRIARVVTFLDTRLALNYPATALRTSYDTIFRDSLGLAWSSPANAFARRHNIEIGVQAARNFEEIQYDYVRLPTNSGLALRNQLNSDGRSALIAQFAKEASEALHAVGAAISFDTFGQTTMIFTDGGIGQILEDLAPYLDYFSPMVYPSTWTTGWFGLVYPPAEPYQVVFSSVGRAVDRLEPYDSIIVRPWLQDFTDYQAQKVYYGSAEVLAQIRASNQAGGQGFMLWDPSLNYQLDLLAELSAIFAAD